MEGICLQLIGLVKLHLRQERTGVAGFIGLLLISLGVFSPISGAQSSMVQVPYVNTVLGIPSISYTGTPAGTPCTSGTTGFINSTPTANGCPGTQAILQYPYGVAIDSAGDLAVAEAGNYGLAVLYEGGATMSTLLTHALPGDTFTPTVGHEYILTTAYSSGIPLTLNSGKYYCGNSSANGQALDSNGDGCAAQYEYVLPRQVAFDPDGNIFFSQLNPSPICIRVLYAGGTRAANLINAYNPTVASSGGPKVGYIYALSVQSSTAGTEDFITPRGIAVIPVSATQENLYVSDSGTSNSETGLDATTSGMQIKEFVCPVGTTGCNTSVNGNTYSATGWATYIVGGGTSGAADGDGGLPGSANLVTPQELLGDKYGNLFFMDSGASRLRVVYNGGTTLPMFNLTTVVGSPVVGDVYTVAGGGVGHTSPAAVNTLGITTTLFGLDLAGNLYFMDDNMLWVENASSSTGQAAAIGFGGASTTYFSANTSPTAGASCNGSIGPITGPTMSDAYADGCPATETALDTPENGIIPFDSQGNFYISEARTNSVAGGVVRKYSYGNNFGTQTVNSTTTAAYAFTPSISGGTTTYTPTLSLALADFTDAGNDACKTETGIFSTQTCVYNVTFKPSLAGARKGSMTLTQSSTLDTILLSGVGTGAQITSDPGLQTVIGSGLVPEGVGLDQSGNSYIGSGTAIYKSIAGATPASFATGLNSPDQIAVDGVGNVFVADSGNNRIATVTAAGGAATAFLSGSFGLTNTGVTPETLTNSTLSSPSGVAVDQGGNVYISDTGNNRVIEVVTSAARNATQNVLLGFSGLSSPKCIAVDAAGDVFVADSGNYRIVELSATGIQTVVTVSPSLSNPVGLAVDAAGDLYIADTINQNVVVVPNGSTSATNLLENNNGLAGVAVDSNGNLFIASSTSSGLIEENRANVKYTYPITAVGSTSILTPMTITNAGNSNLTVGSSLSSNTDSTDFTLSSASTNGCSTSATLTPGQECALTATFGPLSSGAHADTATFFPSSNAVNSASASLSGTGAQGGATSTTTLSIPTPNVSDGQSVSMTATVTLSIGNAAGIISCYDGSVLLGSTALVNGSASYSTSSLSVGTHSITAVYAGQSGVSSGSSSAATIVTVAAPTLLPSQASAAGYKSLVFDEEFNTLNISPKHSSSSNYTWYPGLSYEASPPASEVTDTSGVLDLDWNVATGESAALYDTTVESESANGAAGQSFRYGYFEARMKWDNVIGAWPAFWMEPVQGLTGTKATGEIDIFEGQGGQNDYLGTLHTWDGSTQTWYSNPNKFTIPANNDFTQWHTYGILWAPGSGATPGTITWYYDNVAVGSSPTTTANNSVFDQQDYFLLLSSQEDINWVEGSLSGVVSGQTETVTATDINLYVDWVHVWQPAQTITFTAPTNPVSYSMSPINLSASSTSGLAVTFKVASGPGTISGSTLTVTGIGTIVVNANQAGNTSYPAALQVQQSITVNQASQTITGFNPASYYTDGSGAVILSATGGASGNAVVYTVDSSSTATCTISGTTLTIIGTGICVIDANQAGSTNYSAATQVQATIYVNKATQSITGFNPPASVTYGSGTITLSATGGASGNPVTFKIISGPGTISGSTVTVTGAGTIVVAAEQASSTNYAAATEAQASIVVNKGSQTITFPQPTTPVAFGTVPATLTATSTSGLTVSFSVLSGPGTISGSTLTFAGIGSIVIAADQTGNSNYAVATEVTRTVVVFSTSSTTVLTTSAVSITPGMAVTLTATVTGTIQGTTPTGTVTFSSISTGVSQGVLGSATVNSNGVAVYYGLIWAGTDTITATYNGDANYISSASNIVTIENYSVTGKLNFNWPFVNWAQPVSDGASSQPWPVTLQNLTGVTVATPSLSLSGGANSSFAINQNTCTGSLAQGASCSFIVSFVPKSNASGLETETLTVSTSTSASYANTMPITGTAIPTTLTFNWPFLNFTPTVPVGTASSAWPVTLTNQSSTSTTLASPAVSFSDMSFTLTSDSCSGQTLGTGASCTFSVVFSPLAAEVTTSGTKTVSGTMTATGNYGAISGNLQVGGWAGSALVFNWPFVTFKNVAQGSTGTDPWPVTVFNYSGQALTGMTYNVTGLTNYTTGAFTLTNTCPTLAAGASCTFDVIPTPQVGQATGAYSANLVVSGNASTTLSSYTLPISGTVIASGYSINWNQDQQGGVSTIDFGPQNTKNVQAGPWPITVFNNTPSAETVTLTPSLSVFTTNVPTLTIASGGSGSFNLYFTPTTDTYYNGTLTVSDGTSSYTFNTWGGANK